jgi:hypothetical protein
MSGVGNCLRLAAGLVVCALGGCSTMSQWFGGDALQVSEVRRLSVCNSDGPQPRVSLLADREAVRAWQHSHNVDLIGVDPLPAAGAYVLVERGVRLTAGYGIAVSRQASVSGGVVQLSATLFAPDPGQMTAQMVTSPCVLVALPAGSYRGVQLRDPAGTVLADTATPVQ